MPLMFALIVGINYISNSTSEARIEELTKDLKNTAIIDESGLISQEVVDGSGLTLESRTKKEQLIEAVRTQKKEALIVYPADLEKTKSYDIYLSSNDLTINNAVQELSNTILKTSVFLPLGSTDIIAIAQDGAQTQVTTYSDGRQTAGINEFVVPGLFVVLFYIVFLFSVGYMLTSISEEKENRSMEMMLTYVKPRYLIVGKLLAVTLITFTQLAFFALLGGISLLVMHAFGNTIQLPAGVDLAQLVFDPITILFAVGFFVAGFLLYAGLMTIVAAITPSAKDANNFSTIFYLAPWVPIWFLMTIVTDPENSIVRFLTYFPLTSPSVALIRNTVGNMSMVESTLALVVMIIFTVISIALAVRAFRLGALEFSQGLKLGTLFKK